MLVFAHGLTLGRECGSSLTELLSSITSMGRDLKIVHHTMDHARMKRDMFSRSASADSDPLVLDIDDFKGAFSFDGLFGNLVNEILPSYQEEESNSTEGMEMVLEVMLYQMGICEHRQMRENRHKDCQVPYSLKLMLNYPDLRVLENNWLISANRNLIDLKKKVVVQDSEHWKTLSELEKGVDGLFDRFARLDLHISSVGQT
ncbi:hypothetical protein FXO38_09781 [Capsicum annuum]|nr:hypothetical protein FXO38_09781 [Capsicum annuum]KAF3681224.1 hypothetical protein FXO37_02989 [Capsicum annuum]